MVTGHFKSQHNNIVDVHEILERLALFLLPTVLSKIVREKNNPEKNTFECIKYRSYTYIFLYK